MTTYGLLLALAATLVLNIPFGYMRALYKSMGNRVMWFLAIHAPVPIIFFLRRLVGAGITLIPLFVAAFFIGQLSGGLVYNWKASSHPSACMDLEDLPLEPEDPVGGRCEGEANARDGG